jgi:hypothetical protein
VTNSRRSFLAFLRRRFGVTSWRAAVKHPDIRPHLATLIQQFFARQQLEALVLEMERRIAKEKK